MSFAEQARLRAVRALNAGAYAGAGSIKKTVKRKPIAKRKGSAYSGGIYSGGYDDMDDDSILGGAKRAVPQNPWIKFLKKYAKMNNMSYRDALQDPNANNAYHGMTGGGELCKPKKKKAKTSKAKTSKAKTSKAKTSKAKTSKVPISRAKTMKTMKSKKKYTINEIVKLLTGGAGKKGLLADLLKGINLEVKSK